MAEAPVCKKCSRPHWRFVACDQADEHRAAAAAREQRRVEQHPLRSVPDGYRLPDRGVTTNQFGPIPDGFRPAGTTAPKGFRIIDGPHAA